MAEGGWKVALQVGQAFLSDRLCRKSFVRSIESEVLAWFSSKINIPGLAENIFVVFQRIVTWKQAKTMHKMQISINATQGVNNDRR